MARSSEPLRPNVAENDDPAKLDSSQPASNQKSVWGMLREKISEVTLGYLLKWVVGAVGVLFVFSKGEPVLPFKNNCICDAQFSDDPPNLEKLQLVPRSGVCGYLVTGWDDGHSLVIEFEKELNGLYTGVAKLSSMPHPIVADRVELYVDDSGLGVLTLDDTTGHGRIAELIIAHANGKNQPNKSVIEDLRKTFFVLKGRNRLLTEVMPQKNAR